jgi:putative hydrolase of the HAD superfamily
VLFDFGGVLIDSPLDAFTAYERRHGIPEGFIRQVNATNHLDNAWARFERNECDFDEFCAAFADETAAAGHRVDARAVFALLTGAPRPPMVEALRRLRPHFRTGLLTNNFATPLVADGHDELLALFDVVVASAEVGIRKPDPRFYLLACEQLGVEPGRAVFLDDLGINLKPARALGMRTIKVIDVDRAVDELQDVLGVPLR